VRRIRSRCEGFNLGEKSIIRVARYVDHSASLDPLRGSAHRSEDRLVKPDLVIGNLDYEQPEFYLWNVLLVFKVLIERHENVKVRFSQGKKHSVRDSSPPHLNDRFDQMTLESGSHPRINALI